MRLIDAENAKVIIQNIVEHLAEAGNGAMAGSLLFAVEVIDNAPTVDPVKHGKWEFGIKNGATGYWCSNCKCGFTGENAEWIAKEHDYCPKCGAKMDGA